MGLSWGLKFWAEGSLAADTLPPSRAIAALQGPASKGLRRAVLPSPALHLISGPAGRPSQPGGGGAMGRRRGGGEEGGEVEGRKRTEGEGPERAGGKEAGPGASGGFESCLASVPSSYLWAFVSLPRPSGWESPPNPLPKAERAQAVAWPPRLSAGRRESGSQGPWLQPKELLRVFSNTTVSIL